MTHRPDVEEIGAPGPAGGGAALSAGSGAAITLIRSWPAAALPVAAAASLTIGWGAARQRVSGVCTEGAAAASHAPLLWASYHIGVCRGRCVCTLCGHTDSKWVGDSSNRSLRAQAVRGLEGSPHAAIREEKAHRGVSCRHGRLQGMQLDSLHAVLWRPTGTAACMRTRQCQLC